MGNIRTLELSEGHGFGGGSSVARDAADRAEAAEQAQHGAAARAALAAAYSLAEEARTAAREAEAVAAAKQYHAAHLSSKLLCMMRILIWILMRVFARCCTRSTGKSFCRGRIFCKGNNCIPKYFI